MEVQTITSSWKSNACIAALFMLIIIPLASAQVVVNSNDWRDVYSGMQYTAITDQQGFFVTDTQQATRLLARLSTNETVLLITGREQAMPGFRNLLVSRGYTIEEIRSTNPITTNEELVVRANPQNLIIVGDAYGYNALSVGTYAHMSNSGVLFASSSTSQVIAELQPSQVLVYGHIPSEVLQTFEGQITRTINNQDRFDDNFELMDLFISTFDSQILILTNGDIIEQQLLDGVSPTLFIGRQTVPQAVTDRIRNSNIRTAVLIGNALAPNANVIKDRTGISIFIKFAQGRNQQQFSLDLFSVPTPNPVIQVASAEYDASRQVLLVTYQNPGTIATYFTASLVGEDTVEDQTPVFIESGSYKTVQYSTPSLGEQVRYTLLYGASPRSLDLIVQGSIPVSMITINDRSQIRVANARYDTRTEAFIVTVENTGPVGAYVLAEAVDVRIGNERVRIGSEVVFIREKQSRDITLPAILSERDLTRNSELSLELFFGQREFSLVNFQRATLGFTVGASSALPWTWIVIVAFVAIILGWLITRKKRRRI